MPQKYNLNYFRYSGRTKPILLLFKIANEQHTKNNTLDEWNAIKEEILAKRFPLDEISTLKFNGKLIAQSPEIYRYVASRLNLLGSSDEDRAKVNELIDTFNRLFNKMGEIKFDKNLNDNEKKRACARVLGESAIQRTFNMIVQQVHMHGSKFYFGDSVSAADIYFLSTLKFILTMFPKALAPYRGLDAYSKRIAAIDYLKKDFLD